jgi:hypothetical protein
MIRSREPPAAAQPTFSASTRSLPDNVYNGDLGRIRVGIQYEYWTLNAFGTSPTPAPAAVTAATTGQGAITTTPNAGLNPNIQAVFFSLRYYPFN